MTDKNKVDVTNNKRLMLPAEATLTLKNNVFGLAEGTISVTVDTNVNTVTDIIPFWADDNGKLEEYKSLFAFRVTDSTTVFEIGPIIIPNNATRLLLYALNYDTGETTRDFHEIALPKDILGAKDFDQPIAEFQVVSDIHIQSDRDNAFYIKMLEKIKQISPESLGLFVSGDVTNNGKINEYEKHRELHSKVENAPAYYMAIGNHEFYDGGQAAQKSIEERFVSYARLPDKTNPKSQHYDFWLNGYHFVFLGNDGITRDLLSATFKDETMVWLYNTLMDGRDKARPVFLFCHYPIRSTVSGSLGEFTNGAFTGVWGENADKLNAVLKNFPEVLLFTGHQHFTLGFPKTMQKTEFYPTIFNTSSASQVATCRDGKKQKGVGSEGYFVYVYKDRVIVKGYDFEKEKWIPSAQFYVSVT